MMSSPNKQIKWQQEALMERLRAHAPQSRSYTELAKAMRMGILEKRFIMDPVEKSNLQKCLDIMKKCMTVTSREGLVERLESLSRQLGLKFMDDAKALFISTDMFFLEIILDSEGELIDVKVHHECREEQQSCSELVDCLNRGDFADFTAQLEGFSSIYQLNAEPKVKTKAYDAMMAMETDLYNIYEAQNSLLDVSTILRDSSLGVVIKRAGGHPMRLVYLVPPFDLISQQTQSIEAPSLEILRNKQVGFSVTVNLEAASATKLQILPTVSFIKNPQSGQDMPVYAPLTQMNSLLLPATFVLKLNKPFPVCYNALRLLGLCRENSATLDNSNNAVGLETQHRASTTSANIMNLVIQTATGEGHTDKPFVVDLPDQTHCYYFIENNLLKSTLLTSVQFTEPSQVPKILAFLKKYAIFYTLLCSCIRSKSKVTTDYDSTVMAEVSVDSFQQITVTLQDSHEGSMVAVEFYLRDSNVQCKIFTLHKDYELLSIKLTNIVQNCLSIPITIRALLKHWKQDQLQLFQCPASGGLLATSAPLGLPNNTSSATYDKFHASNAAKETLNGLLRTCNSQIEQNASQRLQTVGYGNYRSSELTDDFYGSPKSVSIPNVSESSVEMETPGETTTTLTPKQLQTAYEQTAIANREIADKYKNIWKEKASTKNGVSITPLNNQADSTSSSNTSLDVQRTGGIEIIPLISQSTTDAIIGIKKTIGNSAHTTSTPSTITITPINSTSSGNNKEKMTSASGLLSPSSSSPSNKRPMEVNEVIKEKKRKKKRDDSPMGPPEKIFSRQNSPASSTESNTNAVVRKFPSPSSSPKPSNSGLLSSAVSSAVSSVSAKPSPKHSPVYSSPKHSTTLNSPKSPFGTLSPKHGPSGKPSMSTLKSATVASPKAEKTSCGVTDTNLTSSSLSTSTLVRSVAAPSVNTTPTSNTVAVSSAAVAAAAAAATAAAMASLRNKEKPNSVTPPMGVSTAAPAPPAVKSNLGIATLQQLKSVPGLNHIGNSFNNISQATASLDLNSVARKGIGTVFDEVENKYGTITVNNPPAVVVNASQSSNSSSAWQQ